MTKFINLLGRLRNEAKEGEGVEEDIVGPHDLGTRNERWDLLVT